MLIKNDNLDEIAFENENARLLILDVVGNQGVEIRLCRDTEISVGMALDIWYRVHDERKRLKLRRTLPRISRKYKLSNCSNYTIKK